MRSACVVFGLALLLAVPFYGQTLGEIVGEVKDASGAVIPGASVTVTNVATNATRSVTTNEAGLYTFPALVPGPYRARVEARGFKTVTRSDIGLQVQQSARIDFSMEVGQVSEAIEVKGSATLMTTENATVGTVIENKRILDMPLNGRNFLQLVALSPSVSIGFGTPGQAGGRQGGDRANQNISLMGMRGTWNRFTLDGVENTDVNFNLYVVLPSIDALQEFKVQSGIYPAEFGRAASQINVSTKPGGNQFHGALFEFMRNDKLDAKQYDFIGTSPAKSPFKYNQYGFTLGGPVLIPKLFSGKDKLFFMANYEGFRQRTRGIGLYTTPTVAMRGGDFSYALASGNQLYDPATKAFVGGVLTGQPFANNQVPKTRFNPISLKLLEFWPEPNVPTTVLSNNFQKANPGLTDKDQFTLRMDFNESSNSQWFGRYSWTDESILNGNWAQNGTTLYSMAKQYMISNTRVLSSSKVNEFRFGVNHFYNLIGLELSGKRDVMKELAIPGLSTPDPITWGIPRITSLVGVSGFGNDSSGPFAIYDAVFQATDNFSWIKGRHSLRFGGEVRRDRYNQKGNEFARGSFEFNGQYTSNPATRKGGDSTADLLMGNMMVGEAALWLAFAQFRATSAYGYVDETYRVNPKLTINAGLRYELSPPWWDRSQNEVNVFAPNILQASNVRDLSLHPVLLRTGKGDFYEDKGFRYPGVPVARDGRFGDRLMRTDYTNWAPRLGIAYSPSSKLTLRTGFGVFYSVESGNSRFDLNRGLAGKVRRLGNSDIPDLNFNNFLTSATFPWVLPASPNLWGVKPNVRNTYSMMYLFNIQRELSRSTVLEVGYNGSLSRNVQGLQDTNQAVPGTVGNQIVRSPFPEFGYLQTVHSEGNGIYSGLGVKLTRRMSAGLTYLLGYTWSKSIDTTSAIRGTNVDIFPQDSYCLSCDRGYSAFNTPHRMVTSIMYELPFGKGKPLANLGGVVNQIVGGWQLGTIATIQSGRPLNMQAGFDVSGTNHYGEIRLSATGQDQYAASPTSNGWFNPAGFTLSAPGTYGNMSRNRLMGPSTTGIDFSTLKNFYIREGHQLQFRFEAFNFPNHPR
ncbi:MAG: carboxypeptidase-like regulatory domain-containing protein, partial [Acidobacteria bacterium]|nr:carboxypeptidase-like regulatory domain-containing protein [Acidobacteriota bacterium]